MKKRDYQHSTKGFTLVELAIVLMIIGLLIGGILRGQELMENARVNGTIQQVKAYTGASVTFKDIYSAMPGDLITASARLPGCQVGNSNFCGNGNGDGHVGNIYADPTSVNQSTTATPQIETQYYWKHLALAHLISGVTPNGDPSNPAWGTGHNLRLQIGPTSNGNQGTMALSPIKARQIDQKMDDGMPDRGSVTADYEGTNCDNGGVYQNTESKNCLMYFNID